MEQKKTYTYDPLRIFDSGVNQLRFELGDTATEGVAEQTCVLCDEEYQSVIQYGEKNNLSFVHIKIICLKAIISKLSYEVNMKVHDLSMDLSGRREHFQEMLEQLEKKIQYPASLGSGKNSIDGGHYFYLGMQENPRAR